MSASMYGKDAAQMRNAENYYPDPPTYQTTRETKVVQSYEVLEVQPIECTPGMLLHPIGLLRLFELALFFMLQWLVQITCGNDACTMIMNVFGYIAIGQVFVLIIFLALSIMCTLVLVLTMLNGHRSYLAKITRALEKVYALLGIILMIIAGAIGTWMAVLTNDPEVNYQGRGVNHIKGQWIAAAVFEFLMAFLYVFDFWLQSRENYPFGIKEYENEVFPTRLELEAGIAQMPGQQERFSGSEFETVKTTRVTERHEGPKGDVFNQLESPPYQPPRNFQQPAYNNQMNYSQPPRNFYGSQM